jgi:hypothetical protein
MIPNGPVQTLLGHRIKARFRRFASLTRRQIARLAPSRPKLLYKGIRNAESFCNLFLGAPARLVRLNNTLA